MTLQRIIFILLVLFALANVYSLFGQPLGVAFSGNNCWYSASSSNPSGSGHPTPASAARFRYSPTVLLETLQTRAIARLDNPAS